MKFRFLKKKDGTKILQNKYEGQPWSNIEMVEEEEDLEDKLREAVYKLNRRMTTYSVRILMSKKFHDRLKLKYSLQKSNIDVVDPITSYYGYRVYIVDTLFTDFKILQEL